METEAMPIEATLVSLTSAPNWKVRSAAGDIERGGIRLVVIAGDIQTDVQVGIAVADVQAGHICRSAVDGHIGVRCRRLWCR